MLQAQPWWSVPDWWAAIGTIAAVVVAIFGESIWTYYRRPRLSVSINVSPPDCHKTQFTHVETGEVVADCYYFRLRIKNEGMRRAEDVEVYAAELLREASDGSWALIEDFPPMDLLWSHVRRPFQSIAPGVARHCDLAYVALDAIQGFAREEIERRKIRAGGEARRFVLELEVKPNRGTYQLEKGTYKLKVVLAAGNVKATEHAFHIIHSGKWFDDEDEMFEKGVRIKQLS